ncbi:carboxylesterase family protein, partial [Streptomyces sp. A7024]
MMKQPLKKTATTAIALALIAGTATAAVAASPAHDSTSVRTDKGTVRGTETPTARTYQGIP